MADENGTLNQAADTSSPSAQTYGELISTVELATPEVEKSSEGDDKSQATEDKDQKAKEGEEEKKASEEDDRFDKHPRFQELIKDKNELRDGLNKALAKIDELEGRVKGERTADQEATQDQTDFEDLAEMDDDALVQLMSEKPKTFLGNLARQLRHEIQAEIRAELSERETKTREQNRVATVYEKFASTHPDFDPLWDSGKITAYIKANPGHNPISAYYAVTESDRQAEMEKKIQEAKEQALKEAKEKGHQALTAKKNAAVLGAGPSATATRSNQVPADLADTSKFGGLTRVLANRAAARRAGSG